MGALERISMATEHRLASFFGRVGWELAARPWTFIFGLIVLAAILASGIPSIKSESEPEKLYTPSFVNRGADDLELYEDMFSNVEGIQQPNYFIAYVDKDDENTNLMNVETLNSLYALHQKIKNLEFTDGTKSVRLADLCVLSKQSNFTDQCEFQGVTDLMSGPIQDISELVLDPALTVDHQGGFQVTALFAGGRTMSSDGSGVQKVKAFRWSIHLDTGRLTEEEEPLQEEWMRLLLNTLHAESDVLGDDAGYKLAYEVEFSQAEELDESTNSDVTLLIITFSLVCTFSFLIVRSYSDLVLSKGNVIWGAQFAIVLAIGSAFGLMGHCGVIFNPVVSTSSLLLLGLGMDDAYVIIQAWHSTAGELGREATVQERMKRTYETAGVSIFFTSITDIVAFAVGCTSTFPAVRGFCAYTATGVLFDFVFQLLFFGAVMALDGHREYCGQGEFRAYLGFGWLRQDKYSPTKDLTARVAPGEPIPVMPEVAKTQQLVRAYGEALLSPKWSAVVLAAFAGYLAYAIVGATQVGTGLDVRDLAATDSYWTVFVNQRYNYFNEKGPLYNVAFPAESVDWSVSGERAAALTLMTELEALDCLSMESRGSWLREFEAFGGAAVQSAEGDAFYSALDQWLQGPGFEFQKDVLLVALPEGQWRVQAARMAVRMQAFESTGGDTRGVPCMRDSREVLDAWQEPRTTPSPLVSFEAFQFWESTAVIVEQTMLNLVYAAACCFLITLLVLPHPVLCCMAMLVVAMILAGLVGTMALVLNIRIETISMINLVISIGFSIDNVAHYFHSYMASKKPTRKEKALDALERIGVPILAGDASTMIALLPLLGSKSQIFRSFFFILFTVLLLGALHAVVLLPVVLGWAGPLLHVEEEVQAGAGPGKKPAASDVVHSNEPSIGESGGESAPAPASGLEDPVVIQTRQ